MSGMGRRAFNLVALVSLLVTISVVGLWLRSYWSVYTVKLKFLGPDWALRSDHGTVSVSGTRWVLNGAGPGNPIPSTRQVADSYSVPYPLAAAVVAMPMGVWLLWQYDNARFGRRGARRDPGRRGLRHARPCTHCGYDLRGSKDVCPECGANLWALLSAVESRMPPGGAAPRPRQPTQAANPPAAR